MAKIALFSLDVVGKSMAGPAIRYWEIAKVLAEHHEVTLLIPNNPEGIPEQKFHIQSHYYRSTFEGLKGKDVVIAQTIDCFMALAVKRYGVKTILDAYDPQPLEYLEIYKELSLKTRQVKHHLSIEDQLFSFKIADAIICASEKQRDLWMGSLLTLGRITPEIYDKDKSLRQLIDVVPFGLSSQPPMKTGSGLRELFHLQKSDKVLLWGGGIWNWFDPLTAIRAVHLLSKSRQDIKLIFMGLKHPNDRVPEMAMSCRAVQLAKELGIIDKHVFFNYGWVPYEERQNFLLEADIGVSMHLEHLETRYSFRTRMLDYIWAGLPIIGTEGDSFAELIQARNLGIAVPYNDCAAVAEAIVEIVDHAETATRMKQNLAEIRPQFYWNQVVKPIEAMVHKLASQPSQRWKWHEMGMIFNSLKDRCVLKAQEKGVMSVLETIRRKLKRT